MYRYSLPVTMQRVSRYSLLESKSLVRIQMARLSGKGKKKGEEGHDSGKAEAEAIQKFILMAEEAKKVKLDFTAEEIAEHQRIAKEYTRGKFRRTNQMAKDLSNKIWLQHEAIRALPAHLQEHALTIDDTKFPSDRPYPIWDTAPIKDFDVRKYAESGNENQN